MSDQPNQEKKKNPAIVPSWLCLLIFFGLFAFVALILFGQTVHLQIPFELLTGWITFLRKNITVLEMNWEITACGIGALIIAVLGLHRWLLWLRKNKPWKWAWTISITVLMLMLFAASISTTGIIHQIGWMAREPLTQSNRRTRLIQNTSSAKMLFCLLVEFDDGRLPESLQSMQDESCIKSLADLQFHPENGNTPEPWIYLGAGKSWNVEDIDQETGAYPILISPRPIRGRWIVLRLDGSVEQMLEKQLREQYPWVIEKLPNLLDS